MAHMAIRVTRTKVMNSLFMVEEINDYNDINESFIHRIPHKYLPLFYNSKFQIAFSVCFPIFFQIHKKYKRKSL